MASLSTFSNRIVYQNLVPGVVRRVASQLLRGEPSKKLLLQIPRARNLTATRLQRGKSLGKAASVTSSRFPRFPKCMRYWILERYHSRLNNWHVKSVTVHTMIYIDIRYNASHRHALHHIPMPVPNHTQSIASKYRSGLLQGERWKSTGPLWL